MTKQNTMLLKFTHWTNKNRAFWAWTSDKETHRAC